MKVIRVSNYDHEGPRGTQHVVKDSLSPEEAKKLADEMNKNPHRSDEDWFCAVPDDESLFVFEP